MSGQECERRQYKSYGEVASQRQANFLQRFDTRRLRQLEDENGKLVFVTPEQNIRNGSPVK